MKDALEKTGSIIVCTTVIAMIMPIWATVYVLSYALSKDVYRYDDFNGYEGVNNGF